MAVEIYHHDATSTTKPTRDVVLDPGLSPNSVRGTSGPYSMQQGPHAISPLASSGKKRRLSKAKTGKPLARSISTPQLRGSVMSDSDADKKRNKLGYQRISIACAHCRRRKIRCLVAVGDPRSRCQNCIRLKKDCVFYPVEQQSAVENKSQSSKAAGETTGASSTVSSSPPEIGAGRPFDERQDVSGPPTLPSNAPSSFPGIPREPGSGMSTQGSFPPPDYNYTQPPEMPWAPQNGFTPHAHPLHHEPHPHLNPNFMRYNHVASPGDVAPFYAEATYPRADAPGAQQYEYLHQRADPHWQHHQPPPPLRSMSYDHGRDMQGSDAYAVGYHPAPSHHYPQMRPLPLSMATQAPGVITDITSPQSAPIPGYHYAYPDQSRAYMAPPEVDAMQTAGATPQYAVQWYQPHPQFIPVVEEATDQKYAKQHDRPG